METKLKTRQKTETEKLFSDLDKPSLHGLSYALRHPDTWPAGFKWDYGDCGQCAVGLAHSLWSGVPIPEPNDIGSVMGRAFAMPYSDAKRIFFWAGGGVMGTIRCFGLNGSTVTPEMIANHIDKYLETVE